MRRVLFINNRYSIKVAVLVDKTIWLWNKEFKFVIKEYCNAMRKILYYVYSIKL